jgi:uncharacterized protein with FMN-binding domain
MKKAIVSLIIIGAFVFYSILHDHSALVADVPTTSTTARPSATSAAPPSPTEQQPAGTVIPDGTRTPGSLYKDGTYDGSPADAQWGLVEVEAIIKNGRITNVKFLLYPNDRNRSIEINSLADPHLVSEAIKAQSATVDIVTGATDSSDAFMQSLSDALSQAKA